MWTAWWQASTNRSAWSWGVPPENTIPSTPCRIVSFNPPTACATHGWPSQSASICVIPHGFKALYDWVAHAMPAGMCGRSSGLKGRRSPARGATPGLRRRLLASHPERVPETGPAESCGL